MNISGFLQQQVDSRNSYGAGEWKKVRNMYIKLGDNERAVADGGIIRYIRACIKAKVEIESEAIKEILTDAVTLRRVWAEDDYLTDHSRIGNGPLSRADEGIEDLDVQEYSFGVI